MGVWERNPGAHCVSLEHLGAWLWPRRSKAGEPRCVSLVVLVSFLAFLGALLAVVGLSVLLDEKQTNPVNSGIHSRRRAAA